MGGAATIFFFLQLGNVSKGYRTALTITGLVTLIATYHYIRIFNSWVDAFQVTNSMGGDYTVKVTGAPFNDAYCYVVSTLVVGLNEATSKQPSAAASSLVANARYLTVISWCTYPFVYIVKNIGLAGATAATYEQIGYSIADV